MLSAVLHSAKRQKREPENNSAGELTSVKNGSARHAWMLDDFASVGAAISENAPGNRLDAVLGHRARNVGNQPLPENVDLKPGLQQRNPGPSRIGPQIGPMANCSTIIIGDGGRSWRRKTAQATLLTSDDKTAELAPAAGQSGQQLAASQRKRYCHYDDPCASQSWNFIADASPSKEHTSVNTVRSFSSPSIPTDDATDQSESQDANSLAARALQALRRGDHAEFQRLDSLAIIESKNNHGKSKSHSHSCNSMTSYKGKLSFHGGAAKKRDLRHRDLDEYGDFGTENDTAHFANVVSKDAPKPLAFRMRQRMLEKCLFCVETPQFDKIRGSSVIAMSSKAYLCFQSPKQCVVKHNFFIAPTDHSHSVTRMDDGTYEHIRNFQKALVSCFASREEAVVFTEAVPTALSKEKEIVGGGQHTAIDCFVIPKDLLSQARLYFHKNLTDAAVEWAQHKKLITVPATRRQSCRGIIPPAIPYFHVDFGLDGGYCQVIEDRHTFPSYLGKEVIRGMMNLVGRESYYDNVSHEERYEVIRKFRSIFAPFDWTKQIDETSGHYL